MTSRVPALLVVLLAAPNALAATPAKPAAATPAKPAAATPAKPVPAVAAKPATAAKPAPASSDKPAATTGKPAPAPSNNPAPTILAAPAMASATPTTADSAPLRGLDSGLGRGSDEGLAQVTATRPADKTSEDQLVPRVAAAKRAATPTVAVTPLGQLLDAVAAAVQKQRPKGTGRVALSFTVGTDGRPTDVLVVSFDPKLDPVLEAMVSAASLARSEAGDYLTYAMQFKRGKRLAR